MKYLASLIFATFMGVMAAGCHPNPANYHVPAGYRTCTSDLECDMKRGEYCGFVGVDTYAVCRGGWK